MLNLESLENALEGLEQISPIEDYVPEGYTIAFDAPQRRGKTLAMVVLALDQWQNGRRVFSNIQLGFPHDPIEFDGIELEDGTKKYRNGHLAIDELNFYFDARNSMSKENRKFGSFLLQQKKQGCHVTGTTHNIDYLDLRFRQNHDLHIVPSVYPEFPRKPEMLRLEISNGPLQPYIHKTLKLPCAPFLGLYDSAAVYDPFKNVKKRQSQEAAKRPGSRARL